VTEEVSLFVIEPATEVPSFRTMVAGCAFEVAVVLLFPQALSSARMAGTAIRANDLNRISIPPDTSLARNAARPISALAPNTGKLSA
jgi:hypothetical protein